IELARQGAAVAVHYAHSEAGALETIARIEESGGKAIAIQGDLGRVSDCFRVVDEAGRALGGLDILVNNSGVTRALDFTETSEAIYNEVFNLNMRGYFFCAQRAVSLMLEHGGGSIINMTSAHGAGGFPRHAAYAA